MTFPEIREAVVVGILETICGIKGIEAVARFSIVEHTVTIAIEVFPIGAAIQIEIAGPEVCADVNRAYRHVDQPAITDVDMAGCPGLEVRISPARIWIGSAVERS